MEAVAGYGLVGREPALDELAAAVAAVRAGRGRLLLISGEPGIGKSALLAAAAVMATDAGMRVHTAPCTPEPGAPPLWPWTRLLRSLATDHPIDPWLRRRLLEDGDGSAGAEHGSFELYEAVTAELERRAAVPLQLAIDDLQWADAGSVGLLAHLARRLGGVPVLLLGAFRDDEAGEPLRALAADVGTVPLAGLDVAAVAELITGIQGTRAATELAGAVRERSGGNPLFVRELSRLAVAQGGWSRTVPDSVAHALRARLARLAPATSRVLEVAALVGREAPVEVLVRVLALPEAQVRAAAEEAVLARVLRPLPDGQGWAFVHDLYPSVLTMGLGATRRTELHAAIGEALAAIGTLGAEPIPAGRLTSHFLAGGEAVRDRARTCARRAADEATQRFGHDEAVRYLELALRLTEKHAADRTDVLLALASARRRAGDPGGAAELLRQVAATGDPVAAGRAALGMAALEIRSGTAVDDNIATLRRAIERLEATDTGDSDPALRARLDAALARELVHAGAVEDDPAEPTRVAERAVSLALVAADPAALATALLARHDVVWRPGKAGVRLPVIADLITAAEAAGDAELRAEAEGLRAAALLELGDPGGVVALRRATELFERLGHLRGRWAALSRRATLASVTGDLDRAERLASEALAIGERIGVPDAIGCYGTLMISLAVLGRPVVLPPLPPDDPVAAIAPVLRVLAGDDDHVDALRRLPLSALPPAHDLESRVAAAAAFAVRGTVEQCRAIHDRLLPYGGGHAVVGGCASYYGPVDYYLGITAARVGDDEAAGFRLRAAAEQASRLGAPAWARLADRAAEALTGRRPETWLRRDGATWRLDYGGAEAHLPDAKGLHDLARLLAAPGQPVHVHALLGRAGPTHGSDPVLDDEAKRAYRRRLDELTVRLEDADRRGDPAASEAASGELAALRHELAAASALHGRDRRLGDEVERARKTVSARIHDALARITVAHPALGAHLRESVTIGTWCCYRPAEPAPALAADPHSQRNFRNSR